MAKISEAGREILKKWQGMGVKFMWRSLQRQHVYGLFSGPAENYSILEQPVPKKMGYKQILGAEKLGLRIGLREKDFSYYIPAQPIPKELLEMEATPSTLAISESGKEFKPVTADTLRELFNEPKKEILIHHIHERKLWLAQREAGTNEQWKAKPKSWKDWKKIPIDEEPEWAPFCDYTVVETVKYYFCVIRRKDGSIGVFGQPGTKEELESSATFGGATIIGNIEERDVEV